MFDRVLNKPLINLFKANDENKNKNKKIFKYKTLFERVLMFNSNEPIKVAHLQK